MTFPIHMMQGALVAFVGSMLLSMSLIQVLGSDSILFDLLDSFLLSSGAVFCLVGWVLVYLVMPAFFGMKVWG